MAFEIELLNERFDVPEDHIWQIISFYWEVTNREPYSSAFPINEKSITDIRNITKWHGDYDGIELEIIFPMDGNRLIWLGVTYVGKSPFSRHEHVLGFIEVNRAMISSNIPVDVRIICSWKPFYLFYKGMADTLITNLKHQPIDQAIEEILDFKYLVERQTYKDIFVQGRAQENIARALLQTFLIRRSYREVPVRGGKSDILVFDKTGRFLYETKIWRGKEYYYQGLGELEEYIIGEGNNNNLTGIFYVIFDPTKTGAAHRFCGTDLSKEIVACRTVQTVIVNIHPPQPSKKPRI